MDDPRRFLDSMSAAYQNAIILLSANHLGVFTALAAGPRTASDLAAELDCDARALEQLLLALVAAEILERPAPGTFTVRASLAPHLAPTGEQSLHNILDHHHHLLARWVQLAGVVRTGRPADVPPRDDRAWRAFIYGMKDISRRSSVEVMGVLPELGDCKRLLDLGGGPGTSAITFCRRWPGMTAVVFDLPNVTPMAQAEIAAAGLADRIAVDAGDYHEDALLADGAEPFDAVYVGNIIHSLSPADTRTLLAKAVAVLAPGGLLVVKDFYLDDTLAAPPFVARFSINMLVGTEGGKSYAWSEIEALARDLGLIDPRRIPVAQHSGLLAARKPR